MTPQALLLGLSGGLFMLLSLSALVTVTLLEDFEFDYDRVPIRLTHSRYPLYLLSATTQESKGNSARGIYLSKILFDKLDVPPSVRTDNLKHLDFRHQYDKSPLVLDELSPFSQVYLVHTRSRGETRQNSSLCHNSREAVWTMSVLRDTPVPLATKGQEHVLTPLSGSFARYVRLADPFFAAYESQDVSIDGDWTSCFSDTLNGEVLTSAQTVNGNWVAVAYSVPQLDGQARQILLRLYRFAGGSSTAPRVQTIFLEGTQNVRALGLQELPLISWEFPVLRIFIAREKDSRPFRTLLVSNTLEWQTGEAAGYEQMHRLSMLTMFPFRYGGDDLIFTVQQLMDHTSFTLDVFSLFPSPSLLTCPAHPSDFLNHTQYSQWSPKFNIGSRRYSKHALSNVNGAMLTAAASVSGECFAAASVPFVIGVDREVEPRLVEILNLPSKAYFRRVAISDEGNLIALLDNHNDLLLLEREVPIPDPMFDEDDLFQPEEPAPQQRQWQVAMELPLSPPLRSLAVLHMTFHQASNESSRPALVLVLEGGVLACLDISVRRQRIEEGL